MSERFKFLSAIFPIILREQETGIQILLHRRQNTGYQDEKWDITGSGHVEEGETAREAALRECKEELGIDVMANDLTFAHLSHRLCKGRTYYDIYFVVQAYSGTPSIMEPDKCSALAWFDIYHLPCDFIVCRKQDIQHYSGNIPYSEKIAR